MSSLQYESLFLGDAGDDKYDFRSFGDLISYFKEESVQDKRGIHTFIIPFLLWLSNETDIPDLNGYNTNLYHYICELIPPDSVGSLSKRYKEEDFLKVDRILDWEMKISSSELIKFITKYTDYDRVRVLKNIIDSFTSSIISTVLNSYNVYEDFSHNDKVFECLQDNNKSPAPMTVKYIAFNFLTIKKIKEFFDSTGLSKVCGETNYFKQYNEKWNFRSIISNLLNGKLLDVYNGNDFVNLEIGCKVLALYLITAILSYMDKKSNIQNDKDFVFKENLDPTALENFTIIFSIYENCVNYMKYREALHTNRFSSSVQIFEELKSMLNRCRNELCGHFRNINLDIIVDKSNDIQKSMAYLFRENSRLTTMNPMKGFFDDNFNESNLTEEMQNLVYSKSLLNVVNSNFKKLSQQPEEFDSAYSKFKDYAYKHFEYLISDNVGLFYKTKFGDNYVYDFYNRYNTLIKERKTSNDSSMRFLFNTTWSDTQIAASLLCNRELCLNNAGATRLCNSLTYYLLLEMVNFKFKNPRINPVVVLESYMDIVSAGIYLEFINSSYRGQLLMNCINITNYFQYRNVAMPFNKYRKDDFRPTPHFSYEDNVGEDLKQFVNDIYFELVARSKKTAKSGSHIDSYFAFIKYIGDAILNNTVSSEYLIMAIIGNYDAPTVAFSGLFALSGANTQYKPFYDIIKYCLTRINPSFFKLFDKSIKEPNDIESYKEYNEYISLITFVSILQRMIIYEDVNKELNGAEGKKYFEELTKFKRNGLYMDSLYSKVDGNKFFNDKPKDSFIKNNPMDDIRNAITIFASTVTNKTLHGNWFENHKDEILNISPLNPEEQHAPF